MAGCGTHLPIAVAQADDLTVVQDLVHGVGGHRLPQILGHTTPRIAALNSVSFGLARGDTDPVFLEQTIGAHMIGVPVRVDYACDVTGHCLRPLDRVLCVPDETAVDQGRFTSVHEEQIRVGKWSLLPGTPVR